MPHLTATCPHCGKVYRITDKQSGRKATCSACRKPFTLSADSSGSVQAVVPKVDTASRAAPSAGTTAGKSPAGQARREPTGTAEPGKRAGEPAALRPPTHTGTPAPPPGQQPSTGSPGTVNLDRFEVIEELGAGAFGTVYKARDTQLDRLVALKIPRFGALGSEGAAHRFLREARAAGNLRHPNIVPIYDAGKVGESYFIASGFIEGQTLADLMDGDDKLSQTQAAVLIRKLAEALHYAHTRGIIHRDVKPANVMMDGDGEPLVMDFGMARRDEGEVLRTQEGARIGTPAYMSPEQHAGQSHLADARSDQWALGVMLYELLTGQRPFRAPNAIQVAYQVRETEPERPGKLDPSISKDLETICLKCLEKEPGKRYASCQDLADDLNRHLELRPISARPISSLERLQRWCLRNPTVAILVVLVVAVLLGGTIASTLFALKANRNRWEAEQTARRAEQNAERAIRAEANAKRQLYVGNIRLAQQALDKGNLRQTFESLLSAWPTPDEEDLRGFEWYSLWGVTFGDDAAFRGHTGCIMSMAYSPDGSMLATGGADATVKIWDAATGELLASRIVFGPAYSLQFIKEGDDTLLLSFISNKPPKLLSVNGLVGKREYLMPGQNNFFPLSGAAHPKGLVAAGGDGSVALWDLRTGKFLRKADGHRGHVRAVSFSRDGRYLASGGDDGRIIIWNVDALTRRAELPEHKSKIQALSFSPDGQLLGSASWDGTARLWNTSSWECVRVLSGHTALLRDVEFSMDGKVVATASGDATVRLWQTATGQLLGTLSGHPSMIRAIAFSPDQKTLAAGSHNESPAQADNALMGCEGAITLWDWPAGRIKRRTVVQERQARVTLHSPGGIIDLCLSPDRRYLAAACVDGAVRLWDVQKKKFDRELGRHDGVVQSVTFSSDGKRVYSSSGEDGTVREWKLASDREQRVMLKDVHVDDLAFCKAQSAVLAASGHVLICPCSGGPARPLKGSPGHHTCIAVHPEGKLAASGRDDGQISLWDLSTERVLETMKGHTSHVQTVNFSPDGAMLASGSVDGTVILWDVRWRKMRKRLQGHSNWVWSVAFSNDGRRLVSGGGDHLLIVWDVETGQRLLAIPGQTGGIRAVAFGANRDELVLGTGDWTQQGDLIFYRPTSLGGVCRDCLAQMQRDPHNLDAARAFIRASFDVVARNGPYGGADRTQVYRCIEEGMAALRKRSDKALLTDEERKWLTTTEAQFGGRSGK